VLILPLLSIEWLLNRTWLAPELMLAVPTLLLQTKKAQNYSPEQSELLSLVEQTNYKINSLLQLQ
jgi:hypothetical protein